MEPTPVIEWWSIMLGFAGLAVTLALFFWQISKQVSDNGKMLERMAEESTKRMHSADAITAAVAKLDTSIERMTEMASKEHSALLAVATKIQDRMEFDHRDQVDKLGSIHGKLGDIKESVGVVSAKLDAHALEERRK